MNEKLRESGFRAQCLSVLMMPLMSFIGIFGYVSVCVVGGAMAMEGKIGFGVIVAFMMYVRYFTQPLSQIAQSIQSLQSATATGGRVFEFLEAEEMEDEKDKRARLDSVERYVEFDHVKFGYEDSDKTIIHDFSVAVKPGQEIAQRLAEIMRISCYGREIIQADSEKQNILESQIDYNEEHVTNSLLYTIYAMGRVQSGNTDILSKDGHFLWRNRWLSDRWRQRDRLFL